MQQIQFKLFHQKKDFNAILITAVNASCCNCQHFVDIHDKVLVGNHFKKLSDSVRLDILLETSSLQIKKNQYLGNNVH
jgi:hypothetical protein